MNPQYEKKVGQNIRRLREEKNMTQEQLSAKLQTRGCDITRSALAKIEVAQRHLYPDEIYHLKHILKISYDELFEEMELSQNLFSQRSQALMDKKTHKLK